MIAICIGHSRPGDSGALSTGGVTEHTWNSRIAAKLAGILNARGIECQIISAYQGNGYSAAMRWLGKKLGAAKPLLAIELHFNCAESPEATGHEWLHWPDSNNGRILAKFFKRRMELAFPALASRGTKARGPKEDGGGFLRSTPCPAVICEPFFGSNESDWHLLDTHQDRYAQVLADGITDWIGGPK